jgi:peptidoglycan hydrolase-like protein with peptidoglycan-binding domain
VVSWVYEQKTFFCALLALFFFLPVSVLGSFDRDLSYGARGTDVSDLQKFLTDRGIYRGPVTGNFYNLTKAAVIEFQEKEGITPPAGYFGPLTRKKANSLLGQSSPNAQGTTSQTQTAAIPATGNTILRIPNGPVVEIDASGKIVRWIEGWPVNGPTQGTNAVATQLSITIGTISATDNSAYLSWTTNGPSDSKIFLTAKGSSDTKIYKSESGYSTQHILRPTGLTPNTEYSYTIEAISGTTVAKNSGSLSTSVSKISGETACIPSPQLTLTTATTSVDSSNFASIVRYVQFNAIYTTGCKIDKSTKYTWKVTGNPAGTTDKEDNGTLAYSSWSDDGTSWDEGKKTYLKIRLQSPYVGVNTAAYFSGGSIAEYLAQHPMLSEVVISMTVGDQTKTITFPSEGKNPYITP